MGELQGIVRFTFHADKVEEFKRLSAECLEIVRTKDAGTLQYDTYFNDDESESIVLERFRDSDALILHAQNMAPLMTTGTVSGELLGDLNEELRAQTADSPVGLFTLYQALTARRDELRRDAAATDWATKAACRHRRHLRPSRSVA